MKTSALILLAFLILSPGNVAGRKGALPTATAFWPADSTVRVYFVRGLFTSEQTETIWKTLEAWTQNANRRNPTVKFVYAGETGGLIDCLGCLTVSRQGISLSKSKRASFNPLRRHETGQLISAWMGFDHAVTDPRVLRVLMLEALARGPGMR